MRKVRIRFVVAALMALAVLPGPSALANRGAGGPGSPDQITEKDFSVERFSDRSIDITNRFLPTRPGTRFTLTGMVEADGEVTAREVIFTVTELTKVVNGVRTQVIWDQDFEDGELVEEELAFWAQDDDGNVWLFGEYPEEIEDGEVSAPSTWLAGIQEAIPGVLMRVNPQLNTSSYKQGEAPAVEFLDVAQVRAVDQEVCVPVGCFDGVLVIDEFDPNQQPEDGHQLKFHAPDVGIVQVLPEGGVEQETLELTEHRTLTPEELIMANARAIELDQRAFTLVPEVWGTTEPATPRERQDPRMM